MKINDIHGVWIHRDARAGTRFDLQIWDHEEHKVWLTEIDIATGDVVFDADENAKLDVRGKGKIIAEGLVHYLLLENLKLEIIMNDGTPKSLTVRMPDGELTLFQKH